MITPEQLREQMANKTDGELSSILERPEDWTSEALEAARTELSRRGIIHPDSVKPLPPAPAAGALPVLQESSDIPQPQVEEKEETKISFRRQAHIGIAVYFILTFVIKLLFISTNIPGAYSLAISLSWISWGFMIWGCIGYAAGKGYSKWFGALGLLCCFGLVILIILPDRRKGFDDHDS